MKIIARVFAQSCDTAGVQITAHSSLDVIKSKTAVFEQVLQVSGGSNFVTFFSAAEVERLAAGFERAPAFDSLILTVHDVIALYHVTK